MQEHAMTVVIALFNSSEFIEEALNSVFAQTMRPAAIIVVDDGSFDDGPYLVKRINGTVDLILIRKQNGGQSPRVMLATLWPPHRLSHFWTRMTFGIRTIPSCLPNHFGKSEIRSLGWFTIILIESIGKAKSGSVACRRHRWISNILSGL
jgi:cellulose synthase/poly-beta-1,6-N-acetylglucosamine synthase-like glycosyltransferase